MDKTEIARLQAYLRQKFGNPDIRLVARAKAEGSVEMLLGDEFVGTIYRDEEDGDISYDLNMAILEADLPAA